MKKYDSRLRLKYNELLETNKQLKQTVINLRSKLLLREQQLNAINCAFDLSQKLTQHLKTENSLLRTSQELILLPTIDSNVSNGLMVTNNELIGDNNRNDIKTNCNNSVDNSLCKNDLIANQYENDIKEWKEESDLFTYLYIDEVVVSVEDQLKANQFLIESDDESDRQMDVEFEGNSKNTASDNSHSTENKTKIKCQTCGRKYSDESLLKEHKSHHKSDDNRIKCAENDCSFKCDSKHELKEHLSIHRNKSHETPKPIISKIPLKIKLNTIPIASKRIFECKQCNKQLSSMQSLRQHQRAVHNMISWFRCKFSGCEQKYEKATDLRLHEELHRKHSLENNDHINKLIPNNSTLQLGLNQNSTQTIKKEEVLSHYFNSINGNSITSDSNAAEVSPISQESVPKSANLFKCQYQGCNAEYRQKSSLRRHEDKVHKEISSANNSKTQNCDENSNDSNGGKKLDMNQRLQLLNLLYAEQQKHAMM